MSERERRWRGSILVFVSFKKKERGGRERRAKKRKERQTDRQTDRETERGILTPSAAPVQDGAPDLGTSTECGQHERDPTERAAAAGEVAHLPRARENRN